MMEDHKENNIIKEAILLLLVVRRLNGIIIYKGLKSRLTLTFEKRACKPRARL